MKIRRISYFSITLLYVLLLGCAGHPRYGIKLNASGSGSDILTSYFKSEASNQGFIIYEEVDATSVDPAYQLNLNTNLGRHQPLDN